MAHVLVIEDDIALQEAYSFILKARDHQVDSAYNGAEGLDKARQLPYDVILLDIHMPIMDGLEFLEQYAPQRPDATKIIVFSNMIEPEIQNKASGLGAHRCVLKSSMTPAGMLGLIEETVANQ